MWASPVVSLSPLLLPPLPPPQIDEMYEAYCVQRRLRDGAYNMVRAYSTGSPGSREARDSLAEATRGHREYTEVRDEDHCGRGTRCGLVRENWFFISSRSDPSFPEHVSSGE